MPTCKAKSVKKILNNGSLKAADFVRKRCQGLVEKGAKRGLKEVRKIWGQYYLPVNLDKGEYLDPHKLGDGLKLMEFWKQRSRDNDGIGHSASRRKRKRKRGPA